jgi:hypothetical protein
MRPVALALMALAATLGAASGRAAAGDNDVVLGRLALVVEENGMPTRAVGQNLELRGLVSELGVALAPRLLTPADTLGFGGFQLTADLASTTITRDATWWRARRGSPDPAATDPVDHGTASLPTVGVFVRKGMWLPLPSTEVGVGMVHLLDSKMWTAQGYLKLALQEGYQDLPIPSIAVRGGVARLIGQKDLDLTIISFDVTVSKHVGVGGTWGFDPFAGWSLLDMIPRTEVIDPTPDIDSLDPANMTDRDLDLVFKDQDDIIRHRLFVGAKLHYHVIELTLEAAFALAGSSVDQRAGTTECTVADLTSNCDSPDRAGSQRTLTVSGGFDF